MNIFQTETDNYGDDDAYSKANSNGLKFQTKTSNCGDDEHSLETDVDRISELPDSLIVQILSLMPITDAFKTTILSKRWQYLWTYIDNLIFGLYIWENYRRDSYHVNGFISFMDNVLPLLRCTKLKKFSLHFILNQDGDLPYSSNFDKWLQIATNKKVEDLYLDGSLDFIDGEPYSLPQFLCSSSAILKLNCQYCNISEDCVLNWRSLKSLTLGYLFLRDEHIEQIMSNCPQLECLKLNHFCGFHRLHVTSPRCRRLQLTDHTHILAEWDSFGNDCFFEIVAPYVQHFEISGDFYRVEIRLGNLSSLVHASVEFHVNDQGDEEIDKSIVKEFLAISMSMWEKEDIQIPLLECKQLTASYWMSTYSFLGIERLLSSTPSLESLTILPVKCPDFPKYWYPDADPSEDNVVSLKETGEDNNGEQENVFKCSLPKLKNIEVISKYCSDPKDVTVRKLLMYLLEHAKVLERLVIAPAYRECNVCLTNISETIEDLLAIPRASDRVVISLG